MASELRNLEHGVLQAMSEALYVVDLDGTITFWNDEAERLTGFGAADVIGRRCRDGDGVLDHVDEEGTPLCGGHCPMLGTICDGAVWEVLASARHRDGHRFPVSLKAAPLRDEDGRIVGAVQVFHDDTRGRALVARAVDAEREALTDPLTGLPNRRSLERALLRLQDDQTRYDQPFAVLFSDIDHFKAINDAHGHSTGDEVLRLTAAAMRVCTRPDDVVGRWGGEEFLLLAPLRDATRAISLAQRLREMVAVQGADVGGVRVSCTISIGVALSQPTESALDTVARADSAMRAAKTAGRDRIAVAPPTAS